MNKPLFMHVQVDRPNVSVPVVPGLVSILEEGFTMKNRFAVGAFAVMALAAASVLAGDALVSGPQEGKNIPGPFHPLNVTGDRAGKKHCLV